VKAEKSVDGVTWTTVGSQTITMASTIYVGLAVSSHVDGVLAAATFNNTLVSKAAGFVEPPIESPEIRVMHWNLHHGNDPNNKWAFPRQMDVIANAKPDIISLNEVEKLNSSYGNIDQAAEIANYMTSKTGNTWYQYMVVGSGASKGIGNAIISRFPLSGTSICSLSSTRNAVHATMIVNGRSLNFWSTHLAVEASSYRVKEATALVACMAAYEQDRIVAGDFNAGTGTPEINKMADYIDGWPNAKSRGVTVNYAGNCDGCTRNSRIDYLFISKQAIGLVPKRLEIIDTRVDGVMASDHKPMVATFDIR
jgi:endonuclease/exonuclease/phosphatase family metal-dependent hydrolase